MQQVFSGFPQGQLDNNQAVITQVHYINGSNYTTTSATLTTIDDTNLPVSINVPQAGDIVEVMFEAQFGNTANGNITGFDWNVVRPTMSTLTSLAQNWNSTAWSYTSFEAASNGADDTNVTNIGHYTALECGIHTFRPRWRVGGGTATIVCQGAGSRPWAVHHVVKIIH